MGLSDDEINAIAYFQVDGPYNKVNDCLRKFDKEALSQLLGYIIHLLKALRKLPVITKRKVYRAVRNVKLTNSTDITKRSLWDAVTTASTSESVLRHYLSGEYFICKIKGDYTGYRLTDSDDSEVFIEPGAKVREVKRDDSPNPEFVVIEVTATSKVLQNAVKMFTDYERKSDRSAIVTNERQGKLMKNGWGSLSNDSCCISKCSMTDAEYMDRLSTCDSFENAQGKFDFWYPEKAKEVLRQQSLSEYKTKLRIISAVFTLKAFPTLSELRDGKAKNPDDYVILQSGVDCTQGLHKCVVRIPVPPCGTSVEVSWTKATTKSMTQTKVCVMFKDYFEVIKEVLAGRNGAKVAVLNIGNKNFPGGGWKNGSTGIQAELFMRTTISSSLTKNFYPINEGTSIYTADVLLFRAGPNEGYRFLTKDEAGIFDVITTYADDYRSTPVPKDLKNIMKGRIANALTACLTNEAKVLVLGAIGCGSYKNPPKDVAEAFRDAIMQYSGYFDRIYFAINHEGIFKTFSDVITKGPGWATYTSTSFTSQE